MDDLDRRIAAALQVNGRATWRQVARAVGSSESTVARRAQQLIDGGFMRVTAVADPIRCGFGYPVLVQLECEVGAADEAAELLAERPDVRFAALVTGAFDVVVELIVPSRRRLARILLEELPEIKGITETTTESVLRNFKTAYDWSRDLLGPTAASSSRPPRSGRGPRSRRATSTCSCSSCSSRTAGAASRNSRESSGSASRWLADAWTRSSPPAA